MNYLVDTNVLSELSQPAPDAKVEAWFDRIPEDKVYVSVFTLGEIQSGIEKLEEGAKRNDLLLWFGDVQDTVQGNILPFDTDTALLWGKTPGSWMVLSPSRRSNTTWFLSRVIDPIFPRWESIFSTPGSDGSLYAFTPLVSGAGPMINLMQATRILTS